MIADQIMAYLVRLLIMVVVDIVQLFVPMRQYMDDIVVMGR